MPRDGRETGAERPKRDHRRRERQLLALAARQGGVVSLGQLIALGFSVDEVKRRVACGRLHRLYRGVYAVGRADVSVKGRRLAAVLACGEGAVLSHVSAAAHLGLLRSWATRLDVTVPRRSSLKHAGIRIHRSPSLTPADLAVTDGVPCTSVARTLLDIASVVHERRLESAIEQAHILEIYDHRAVVDVLGRSVGQPGTRALREVAKIARPGETVTKSDLEEAMLAICRRHSLPEPEVNAWILLGGEHRQVDFVWRRQRVAVEVDSYKYHGHEGAFGRDRRRDQLLAVDNWKHARFTGDEINYEEGHVDTILRSLLSL